MYSNNHSTVYTPFTFNHINTNNLNTNNYNYNMDDMPCIGSSPTMSTPYLDSSSTIDTPYNVSSPFFDAGADFSPYVMYQVLGSNAQTNYSNNNNISIHNGHNPNGVRNMNDHKEDVCIARYLEGHEPTDLSKAAHDPLRFNGDPSLLLIDKTRSSNTASPAHQHHHNTAGRKPSPIIKLETVTEEDSDSLFPPLNSSQESASSSYSPIMKSEELHDMSLDDILACDAGSPLSEPIDDDDDSDSLYDEEDQQMQQQQQTQRQSVKKEASTSSTMDDQEQSTKSRKRKASSGSSSSKAGPPQKRGRSSSAKKSSAAVTTEEKLYQCPLCDHVSKRRYNLTTHIKTHDKSRIKEFDCPTCHKSFDRRHDRDRHLATVHRGERSYSCNHCTTHFSRRDALNRHLVQKHDYDEEYLQ